MNPDDAAGIRLGFAGARCSNRTASALSCPPLTNCEHAGMVLIIMAKLPPMTSLRAGSELVD
jgi:hypothetical protein